MEASSQCLLSVLLLQLIQLLKHGRLGVDLLKLSVFQLLAASQTHLQVFDGADLLLEAADLLRVGVLRSIGTRGIGTTLLRGKVAVAISVSTVGVAAAAATVVSGLAPVVDVVVTTGPSASLGAASLTSGTSSKVSGRRHQAGAAVGLALGSTLALVGLLVALLLVLCLGRVFIANRLGPRDSPATRRGCVSKVSTGDGAALTAKAVGTDVGGPVAHKVGSAALILALEVQRRGQATSARRTVGTRRLAGCLDRAQVRRGRSVWGRDGGERVTTGNLVRGLRAPNNVVQLDHIFVVHDAAADVPQLNAVVHAQSRRGSRSHEIAAIRAPLAHAGVSALNGGDLAEVLLQIVDVDLASKVAETGDQNESTSRGEGDGVSGSKGERVRRDGPVVEDGGLGWHVAINDTKLFRVWRPRDVVDRALLIQGDTGIECASGAQQIQRGLAIVALARAIDLGLGKDQKAGALLVPFQLDLVALEEGLLGDGAVEEGDVEHLDGSGLTL